MNTQNIQLYNSNNDTFSFPPCM